MTTEYIPPLFSTVPDGIKRRGTYAITGRGEATAILDSGAVSSYRMADHGKPQSILGRVQRQVTAIRGKYIPPAATTQQGSAAASPTTYQQTLWPQRYEKANYIADNYNQWYNDPACRKSCNMYVYEAVRGGVKIRVSENSPYGSEPQDIADDYIKLWPVHGGPDDGISLMGGGLCAMIAGEFWPQASVAGVQNQYIERFLNLPAVGMERRTDDADQFIDIKAAYSQVDTQTWAEVGSPFPFWSVYNARWNWIPGSKNGNPEIISVRRLARLLELMESCKVTQVQVRSSMRYVYRYGTEKDPATINQVKDLMALNGFVEGKREIFDPTEIARDVHMTGIGGIDVLEGDQQLGTVDHLMYFLDRYCNGLPTPKELMGLGAKQLNRDTLDSMRSQWMADTVRVNQFLEGPIKFFFELQLLLAGINPDLVDYEVAWSKSTTETEAERIKSVVLLRDARIISQKTSLEMTQEYTKIPDIEVEMKLLAEESEQATKMEERKRTAGVTNNDRVNDERKTPI